jgi:pimeloyl-ACP methyl ester carboxylesterase
MRNVTPWNSGAPERRGAARDVHHTAISSERSSRMGPRFSAATLLVLTGMLVMAHPGLGRFHTSQAVAVAQSTSSDSANDRIRDWIEHAIAPDTRRGAIRLPEVGMDETGDLTVVVALREVDDLDGFRAAAEEDVFSILRAVYTAPDSPVRTVTVVGTYPVAETGAPRELPVLRTVLSAEHAATIDWEEATPRDLFTAADVYRLYPPFGDSQGNPIAPPAAPAPKVGGEDPVISSPINIGGRLLFLRCIGSGGPTVILEAGYGDNGTIWAPVQIHASEFVRVCSYDRAGLERSDEPDHYPRTGAETVADLHAALQAAEVKPPYLLVGHSYGALFSRLFAETYPSEVAGLLLLDPWPEDYNDRLQAMVTDQQWTDYESMLAADPDNEVIDFPATYEEIRAAGPLPDVPLLVLSHGQPPTDACCPKGWPIQEQEQLWQTLQEEQAHLTPAGKQEVVAGSGHMIHQAKPEVVVDAIAEMVKQLRD